MDKEQIVKLINEALEKAIAPILKRLETAERRIEAQVTEIEILKQGGNL